MLDLRGPVSRGGLAPWQQKRCGGLYRGACRRRHPARDPLAELARLSPIPFSPGRFKAFLRPCQPHRYHANRRIERAKQLLANRELSVTNIALDVGFSETSTFSAAFHRVTANPEPVTVAISIKEVGEADAGLPLRSPIATAEPPEQPLVSNHLKESFRHPAMIALAATHDIARLEFQRHSVKQACLYTRRRHGSRNCQWRWSIRSRVSF